MSELKLCSMIVLVIDVALVSGRIYRMTFEATDLEDGQLEMLNAAPWNLADEHDQIKLQYNDTRGLRNYNEFNVNFPKEMVAGVTVTQHDGSESFMGQPGLDIKSEWL